MENKPNIAYLLGAGASYNAVPVVSQTYNSIIKAIELFNHEYNPTKNDVFEKITDKIVTKINAKTSVINELNLLASEVKNHLSFDTLAKKYYLQNSQDMLKKLKIALTCFYYIIQQSCNADIRYDAFWASILGKSSNDLPKRIKIISWNYDFQLEKSYSEYSGSFSLNRNQMSLNLYPNSNNYFDNPGDFAIFKLNGTLSLYNRDIGTLIPIDDLQHPFDFDFLEDLTYNFYIFSNYPAHYTPELTFAWENNPKSRSVIDMTKQSNQTTEILVSIGYSFPFFNREVDREIISSMKNLKKVYFQGPIGEPEKYRERFKSIAKNFNDIEIELIHDTDSFFIPYEL